MNIQRFLAVSALICCSSVAATAQGSSSINRVGLSRPTDQPVQISDSDLSSLIDNMFGSDSTTQSPNSNNNNQGQGLNNAQRPPGNSLQDDLDVNHGQHSVSSNNSPDDCECVPYYQCDTNRTIIEDGTGLIDIRLKGPCDDYMEVCCQSKNKLPINNPVTRAPPRVPFNDSCGRRNFEGVGSLRITGNIDHEAQFGEFPWVVAIFKKQQTSKGTVNMFHCCGSLINVKVVLTAAHCVKGKFELLVRAGEWDTQRTSEPLPIQNRPVREVVVHEQFHEGSLANDVALLFLEAAVDPAPNVAPICLPEQGENMDRRQCVASGWGKDVFGKEGVYQAILKKVELPVVERPRCQEALRKTRLGRHFQLHNSFMCAGGEIGKDTCMGDGGGPLMCPSVGNPAIYVQAGIVAWGIGCGTDTPAAYVNVAQFRNWIDNKMSMYNIDPRLN